MFEDLISDMKANEKLSTMVTKLFMRGRMLNILLVFLSQYYFEVPKDIRIDATHYFTMKIPNKRELQQ